MGLSEGNIPKYNYVKLTQEEQTADTSNIQIPGGIVEACIPEIFSSIP